MGKHLILDDYMALLVAVRKAAVGWVLAQDGYSTRQNDAAAKGCAKAAKRLESAVRNLMQYEGSFEVQTVESQPEKRPVPVCGGRPAEKRRAARYRDSQAAIARLMRNNRYVDASKCR